MQADAYPGLAFITQARFAEYRIFLQIGQLAGQQLLIHGEQEPVALADDAKARQHAPLDVAAGAQAAGRGVEVVEIAGQLTLEELGGIHAVDGENPLVVERAEECGHRNFHQILKKFEDQHAQYHVNAVKDVAEALTACYGKRDVSLQQLSATFRRGDLLEYLPAPIAV